MADRRSKTSYLVLHCSATPAKMDVDAKEIKRWHLERGFIDIGYHYVIKRDGTREKGRNLDVVGAHVAGYNHKSVGICLVGGMDANNQEAEDNFTAEQWVSLDLTLRELLAAYPTAKIVGHRDLDSNKQCPSFDVQDWLKGLPHLAPHSKPTTKGVV